MNTEKHTTMVTAAVAVGVLVAAGTAWVGSEEQTEAAPRTERRPR